MSGHSKSDPVEYPGEDGFAVLEMDYKGDRLSMVIVAPNQPSGLPGLEERLDEIERWIGRLQRRAAHVCFPGFSSSGITK